MPPPPPGAIPPTLGGPLPLPGGFNRSLPLMANLAGPPILAKLSTASFPRRGTYSLVFAQIYSAMFYEECSPLLVSRPAVGSLAAPPAFPPMHRAGPAGGATKGQRGTYMFLVKFNPAARILLFLMPKCKHGSKAQATGKCTTSTDRIKVVSTPRN